MGPVGPTDKVLKKGILGTLPFWNGKDPDPYQIGKQDPDPDPRKSEKQDPDPYQKGLDPQHWC